MNENVNNQETKKTIKCPVCGKEGIADYHQQEVICPGCSTDLSIYMALQEVVKTRRGKRLKLIVWKALTVFAFLLAFIFMLKACSGCSGKSSETANGASNTDIALLQDSISILKQQIAAIQNDNARDESAVAQNTVAENADNNAEADRKAAEAKKAEADRKAAEAKKAEADKKSDEAKPAEEKKPEADKKQADKKSEDKKSEDKKHKTPKTPSSSTYTVKAGDSFWKISVKVYGDGSMTDEIARMNGGKNAKLQIGDKVRVK